jgi:hypothetical protein
MNPFRSAAYTEDLTRPPAPIVTNNPAASPVGASGKLAPPMSAAMAREDAAEMQQARLAYNRYLTEMAGGTVHPDGCIPACPPTSDDLAATQQDQQTSYWCGPAAVSESLQQISGATHLTQSQAANQLGTTPDGTDWSDGTGYPVANVMNANTPSGNHYSAHAVGAYSASEKSDYESALVNDVYGSGQPIIGDQWITENSQYVLAGEPVPGPGDPDTYHWWNIRGYDTNSVLGDRSDYEDSAWTHYGTDSAKAVVTMVSGRGYMH